MVKDRSGFNFFERYRRFLTAVFLVVGIGFLLMTSHARPSDERAVTALSIAGAVFVLAGVSGRVWCTAYIGGRKNAELVTKGPYSMTRNPLYFFSFLGGLGLCLELKNLYLIAMYIVAFPIYYHYVIMSEERRLDGLFGASFQKYRSSTPAFFPNIAMLDLGDLSDVSTKHVMKNAMDGMVFVLLLIAAYMFDKYQASGAISSLLGLP